MGQRVFLVDDEQPVLDGLSATIRKFFPDIDICGLAKTGRDAVEGVAREKPDVVLMDVRMPGMSGLDALKELKRLTPDTLPILLTAYERFDIAREAFSLGVYDYLVKPVEQETLVAALRGALELHAERKEAALRACAARNELELARPLLEEGLIYTLIFGDADEPTLMDYCRRLGLEEIAGVMAVVGRRAAGIPELMMTRKEAGELRSAMEYRIPCVVGAPHGYLLPVFFPAKNPGDAGRALAEAIEAMREPGLRAALGAPRTGKDLRRSWAEAVAALAKASGPDEDDEDDRTDAKALGAARTGDFASAAGAFRSFAAGSRNCGETAALAGALIGAYGGGAEAIRAAGASIEQAAEAGEADRPGLCAAAIASALAALGPEAGGEAFGHSGEGDRRVRIALAFIAESYADQISLDDAASRVGLSAAHLSRLLVEQTGKSFIDHLTEARIRRAREELISASKTVKEIAAACGYPDANYFSRAFKKIMGATPSEYAKRHGRSIV